MKSIFGGIIAKMKTKKKINPIVIFLGLALLFYFSGLFLIKPINTEQLIKQDIVEQEEYTYTDDDGEEYEGVSFLMIDGIGKVFTYKDIYFSSVTIFIVAIFLGGIVFGKGIDTKSSDSLKHVIFANNILGVLLIMLTTKDNIWPTILFWLGIVSAYICSEITTDKNTNL